MNAEKFAPALAGRTGTKVHAATTKQAIVRGEMRTVVNYIICNPVNTHVLSRPVSMKVLAEGTEITCEHCKAMIAKMNEQ